ncbi:MAG TPA: glycosyltransferase family 4 protein [Solirubrobacteraceae bacterium]|jgi:glycosyltransferase involved in cell wall biosynthesis|nr:glycosyltransferase family 4 protein [Solirubrobacteraceae bacterium]
MSASTDLSASDHAPAAGAGLSDRWRRAAEAEQEAGLPRGAAVVSCTAPLGTGGLGRHLSELADALRRRNGSGPTCICGSTGDGERGRVAGTPTFARLAQRLSSLGAPLSPALRTWATMSEFDASAARRLPRAEHLIAFNGQACSQFDAARELRYESIALVSANSHLRRVIRQHACARRQYPIERTWPSHLLRRNLAEYARADRIYVASRYIRDSFLAEGVGEERLASFPLTPHPRYDATAERIPSERFDVVYVGSLAVHKGVPLLIDAVRSLAHRDLRLLLVGGWGTRGMRRFVEDARARDARIVVCPGDPLPRLRAAALCVHPAYEDGFGYAPAEALACGVPVLVSEDTGMKDLIDRGRNGLVLPTGDLNALTEAIDAAYRAGGRVG